MRENRKKWKLYIGLTVAVILFLLIKKRPESSRGYGMFSWNAEVIEDAQAETLAECIKQADVTEIYQEFPEDIPQEEMASFVKRMGKGKVIVYAVLGQPEWAYEREQEELLSALKRIADYNEGRKKRELIQGVMVDVEPYLLAVWDEGEEARAALMEEYLGNMESAFELATANGLEFLVCIPTFYDVTNDDTLKKLVEQACDGIAVMNYNRTDEYGQIAKEVGYAREYGKKIICIYELQRSGTHDLEEINTYADEGLYALWESAENLKLEFDYDQLYFAYHYYEPLTELLKEINSMDGK